MALSSSGCGRPFSSANAIGLPLETDTVFAVGPFSLCIKATVLASESRTAPAGRLRFMKNQPSRPAINTPARKHPTPTPAAAAGLILLLAGKLVGLLGCEESDGAADEADPKVVVGVMDVVEPSGFASGLTVGALFVCDRLAVDLGVAVSMGCTVDGE
jgi:hypothetical protein